MAVSVGAVMTSQGKCDGQVAVFFSHTRLQGSARERLRCQILKNLRQNYLTCSSCNLNRSLLTTSVAYPLLTTCWLGQKIDNDYDREYLWTLEASNIYPNSSQRDRTVGNLVTFKNKSVD